MMTAPLWVALPVVGPLTVAGILLVIGHSLPRPIPDVIAVATALSAAVICSLMVKLTAVHPMVYWFGGWTPQDGFPIGIGFVVDPIEAELAAFIAGLFVATLVFAWGYFDEVHAHFHVLMLLFMSGMLGFCFTHDLFDLFVWFEVMSVAGFALTGYQLRSAALEGALNFTVTNAVGGYLFLAGIGLIYARVGALDFSALAVGVAAHPHDIVVETAFALIATALLIKGAQVPFQAWLADAHSVAPSPVSVIFSGAMVSIAVYGIAKLAWSVFAGSDEIQHVIRTLLLAMGAFSAVIGGVLALMQRHVKRLLAFSTISHVGILLIAVALWDRDALAGMLEYLVGHGLVKGSLFMIAGILLALCGGIDELDLRGRGLAIWPAGIAMAAGGVLLAGLPVGVMSTGADAIDFGARSAGLGWLRWVVIAGAAFTGGAVLRTAGRVFLGLGPLPGEERNSPTEDDKEKADRPLWLMLVPTIALLGLALAGTLFGPLVTSSALSSFMHPDNAALLQGAVPSAGPAVSWSPAPASPSGWISLGLAFAIAALELFRHRLPGLSILKSFRQGFAWLRYLHSGDVREYIVWTMLGLVTFVLAFALA